ncbi:hypothetical protein LUZ60_009977 [Juncus effusus]|nr:hypothetical protein LUZ60_009977 [Juncus effusus]
MEGLNFEDLPKHLETLEEELKKLGLKIKHHEDNLRYLKSEIDAIDESLLDMRVNLGKYHSRSSHESTSNSLQQQEEEKTLKNIIKQEGSAAGIICQMKFKYRESASRLPCIKDVIGVVANLAKTNDDNLSRLLAEYLGEETMLGIVCKTQKGVKELELYDINGNIDYSAGLHGLGPSIGKSLNGRFLVFCLENLRPFPGEFIPNDPQRRLALHKPRLANGEVPPGFIGFAVNLIYFDRMHLMCLTHKGHGLRETLFYNLFSKLQVYKTRNDMFNASPFISDGAISLDGGIVKKWGVLYLGNRANVEVKFPVSEIISKLPLDICEIEERIKLANWRKERLIEDLKREEILLDHVKKLFSDKKHEMKDFLAKSALAQSQILSSSINSGKLKNSMLN